jgi:hypothetical protein
MMGCASKDKNPLESLLIIPMFDQHEIQIGGAKEW